MHLFHTTCPANPAGPAMPGSNPPVPNQPALMQSALAAPQIIHLQVLQWSHFMPEFVGRPEEDAEAHLLHTNDGWLPIIFCKMWKCKDFV